MDNNMEDLINNVQNMINSGNIPSEIQQMMNNIKNSNSHTDSSHNSPSQNMDINNLLGQISPEMINNLTSKLNSSSSTS